MVRSSAEAAAMPAEPYRVATAIFPEGNLLMGIREAGGPRFQTEDFALRFPRRGQPALAPARLALVTVFPYLEGVADRQAAENVRRGLDWTDALALP